MAGLHPAVRSNTPPEHRRGSTFEDIPAQFPIEFCCFALLPILRLKVPLVSNLHSRVPLGIVQTEEMVTSWYRCQPIVHPLEL
jgi:hypothetical protein